MNLPGLILNVLQLLSTWPIFKIQREINVCETFKDYLTPSNNSNCYHNSDLDLDINQLVLKYTGTPLEIHKTTTEDGYILQTYRISRANSEKVIYLHHPLTADGSIFTRQGNASLAFILWHSGYEVWLGNQRGSPASAQHINKTITDYSYWNFSFHEVAIFDLPVVLTLIKRETQKKITYIGHSMGTTVAMVYSSLKPDEAAELIEEFVFIGPVAFFRHTTSPLVILTNFQVEIENLIRIWPAGSVLIFLKTAEPILQYLFIQYPRLLHYLNLLIAFVYGWTPWETDAVFINADFFKSVQDISVKNLYHFFQLLVVKERFQMYDYGPMRNRQHYGTEEPPEYPLENIKIPIFMMYCENDSVSHPEDSAYLAAKFRNSTTLFYGREKIVGLNHFQIYYGKHRLERFIEKLLTFLQSL